MTVKEIITYLQVSRQNLTPILARLEKRGWIKRALDPADNRIRRITLTPMGIDTWAGMQTLIEAFYIQVFKNFSLEDQSALLHLLDRLKDGLNDT